MTFLRSGEMVSRATILLPMAACSATSNICLGISLRRRWIRSLPRSKANSLCQQFALAADVAAVALGDDVLAQRRNGLAGHDLVADSGLQRHLEHLSGNQLGVAGEQIPLRV